MCITRIKVCPATDDIAKVPPAILNLLFAEPTVSDTGKRCSTNIDRCTSRTLALSGAKLQDIRLFPLCDDPRIRHSPLSSARHVKYDDCDFCCRFINYFNLKNNTWAQCLDIFEVYRKKRMPKFVGIVASQNRDGPLGFDFFFKIIFLLEAGYTLRMRCDIGHSSTQAIDHTSGQLSTSTRNPTTDSLVEGSKRAEDSVTTSDASVQCEGSILVNSRSKKRRIEDVDIMIQSARSYREEAALLNENANLKMQIVQNVDTSAELGSKIHEALSKAADFEKASAVAEATSAFKSRELIRLNKRFEATAEARSKLAIELRVCKAELTSYKAMKTVIEGHLQNVGKIDAEGTATCEIQSTKNVSS